MGQFRLTKARFAQIVGDQEQGTRRRCEERAIYGDDPPGALHQESRPPGGDDEYIGDAVRALLDTSSAVSLSP